MAEFTDADVTRLAEMLREGNRTRAWSDFARYLLEQGVTLPPPPPDPAVVVADALRAAWGDDTTTESALRDLFAPEALAQAAAKVQEAES